MVGLELMTEMANHTLCTQPPFSNTGIFLVVVLVESFVKTVFVTPKRKIVN